jgi:hypothetical protein
LPLPLDLPSQLNGPVPGWTLLLLPACRSTWHGWYIEQGHTNGIDYPHGWAANDEHRVADYTMMRLSLERPINPTHLAHSEVLLLRLPFQ